LHSALGLIGEDNAFNSKEMLSSDFIIIDEFSMVDMKLATELFSRLKVGAKILLVGDADQLPSVGPGNVFRELINSNTIPVTVLDVVYRQANTSRIALNANAINKGETKLLYGTDFQFISSDSPEDAAQKVREIYRKELEHSNSSQVQILSPFKRKGEACVDRLNDTIRELINPSDSKKMEVKMGEKIFRKGDRVLQIKNKGIISNGDIGFINSIHIDDEKDTIITIVFSDERTVEYSPENMDMIELSYAVTIHKSQGSEYDTVIIPMLKSFYVMLQRNLIYTAITRAKKRLIFVGEKKALYMAIHSNDVDQRNTILGERIKKLQANYVY